MYKYINQKDLSNNFVFGTHPNGRELTIEKNGCGLCSATMIAQNLAGADVSLRDVADLATKWGYHQFYVPNHVMKTFAPVLAETFNLRMQTSCDGNELLDCLHHGGMAIAHSCGDLEGHIGILSHNRHYVAVASAEGRTVTVLDPSLVPGKYDEEGRKGLVTVCGNEISMDIETLVSDCTGNIPYFFLFSKKN